MILTIIISILLSIIFIIFIYSTFKIFYIDNYPPNTIINGCTGDGCIASNCIGYNCKCLACVGNSCQGGYCVGENCTAGDCYGENCKAGDCFGYGCKPGVCYDPKCTSTTCPQIIKNCKDGTAGLITKDLFYLKNRNYFPTQSILNPKLCKPYISLKDILAGRANTLNITNTSYNFKSYTDNELNVLQSSKPSIFKNINCDFCIKNNTGAFCHNTNPYVNNELKILWK